MNSAKQSRGVLSPTMFGQPSTRASHRSSTSKPVCGKTDPPHSCIPRATSVHVKWGGLKKNNVPE